MKKKSLRIIGITLAVVIGLAACAPAAQPTPEPAQGDAPAEAQEAAGDDELRVVMNALPITMDPVASNDIPSARARRMVFEPLIFTHPMDLTLEPGLATSWDMPDPYTMTIELRQGVYFTNGDPFNAEAVRFTLERAMESSHTMTLVEAIEEVEIVDDYNVILHLNMPFVPMPTILSQNQMGIVNPNVVLAAGEGADFNDAEVAVGTGPLVFESFMPGAYMSLVRNEAYWGDNVAYERLTFRAIPEQANRLIEIETGNADIALDIAPIDVPHAMSSPDLVLHTAPSTSVTYVGFNMIEGPLADVRVRHAISYAVDMEAVVHNAFAGTGLVADSMASFLTWGHYSAEPFELDLDRARELLAEAGFPEGEGLNLRIWYNAGNQQRSSMAEMIQNQLRQVGIELVVETLEWASYLERTANAEHDMFILGWSGGMDPDQSFFTPFHSVNVGNPGNRSFLNNPMVDELLMRGRSELDYNARLEIYAELQRLLRDEAPIIPAVNVDEIHVTHPRVNGFYPTPNMGNRWDLVYFGN